MDLEEDILAALDAVPDARFVLDGQLERGISRLVKAINLLAGVGTYDSSGGGHNPSYASAEPEVRISPVYNGFAEKRAALLQGIIAAEPKSSAKYQIAEAELRKIEAAKRFHRLIEKYNSDDSPWPAGRPTWTKWRWFGDELRLDLEQQVTARGLVYLHKEVDRLAVYIFVHRREL